MGWVVDSTDRVDRIVTPVPTPELTEPRQVRDQIHQEVSPRRLQEVTLYGSVEVG